MGGKQSTSAPRVRTFSGSAPGTSGTGAEMTLGATSSASARLRARSLGSFGPGPGTMTIPSSNGNTRGAGSPDSDSSSPEEGPTFAGRTVPHSLPLHLFALHGIKCPVCSKFIPPDDIECHLVLCLTKPRISYNEDVLTEDKGECVICLDDLEQGDTIARLPCLCIYHKGCIDKWFEKNRSCPEHPAE
ncbi:E3 ubiquitin-protein ligase ZNRF2-like [Argopecten irradians]|uniref:E3 ubiquitin-protein ligase ZNRF2-like n=1 Tax=Argopecten irradians TaxID=31199 RepID=UPI003713D31E